MLSKIKEFFSKSQNNKHSKKRRENLDKDKFYIGDSSDTKLLKEVANRDWRDLKTGSTGCGMTDSFILPLEKVKRSDFAKFYKQARKRILVLEELKIFNEMSSLNYLDLDINSFVKNLNTKLNSVKKILELDKIKLPTVFEIDEINEKNFEEIKEYITDKSSDDNFYANENQLSSRQKSTSLAFLEGILNNHLIGEDTIYCHEIWDFVEDYYRFVENNFDFKEIELKILKGLIYCFENCYDIKDKLIDLQKFN